jgi:hypothetical protein
MEQREHHDFFRMPRRRLRHCVEGIKEAVKRGFRVTTERHILRWHDPNSVRAFFDE